jgi:glycosyltransferase involved in cell wall biosynthesis
VASPEPEFDALDAAPLGRCTGQGRERRLRILMSAYACAPSRGSELANGGIWPIAMARRDHDVTVLTTPRFRDEIFSAARGLSFSAPTFRFLDDSLPSSPVARGQLGVYAKYLAWQCRIVDVARRLHDELGFDVVHLLSWGSLRGGSRLDGLGAPLVLGPVGGAQTAPVRFLGYFGSAAPGEILRSIFATALAGTFGNSRQTARAASIVLATNRETLKLARRLGGRLVEFFPDTGIDPLLLNDAKQRDWHDPTLRLVWVGRLFPHKALRIAFEALAQLSDETRVHPTVVGDGPERDRLIATATALGVSNWVDWLGQVPWRSAIDAMDAAHALVFTSLRDSSGAQLLEAMARGLPVNTLDHQGAADHVPDGAGIKIPVTTPRRLVHELASTIGNVWLSRSKLAALSENAAKWAATQTWDMKAARMEAVYCRVVGTSPVNAPKPGLN